MMSKIRLEPTSWIKAAFRSLTAGGPQAIRIEAIARDLKVSKGSFYWHFKDVLALKVAMIEHWRDLATRSIIEQLDKLNEPPVVKLRLLVEISTNSDNDPYGGKLVEAAIRDWARYDPMVAANVKNIDSQRLLFTQGLFEACGIEPKQAVRNATILYGGLIGLELLAYHELANEKNDLSELLNLLLEAK